MQRLEVSGAVRRIYGSLGVKRLKDVFISEVSKRDGHEEFRRTGISNADCVEHNVRFRWLLAAASEPR